MAATDVSPEPSGVKILSLKLEYTLPMLVYYIQSPTGILWILEQNVDSPHEYAKVDILILNPTP